MKKVLLVDWSKCTGCDMCVDICSGRKAGVYSEEASRIRVHKNESEADFIPQVCEHCREHPCVDVCPVEAIRYDDHLSIFNIDENACTGCGACEEICHYYGVFISKGVALKCDLCGGNPPCVEVCYPKALQFVEVTKDVIMADLSNKMDKLGKMGGGFHE